MAFDKDYAPYAFTGNVLDILNRLRTANLPEYIDIQTVIRVGVSEGNASRTIKTLEFLGLIDKAGKQTERMEALGKAPENEYNAVLADVIRDAYARIFEVVIPETATETEITDAFRGSKPSSQWQRAATLFIGLSREAGILEGEPATAEKPVAKSRRQSVLTMFGANEYLANLEPLFQQLPPYEGSRTWDADTRAKWLKAFESMLDLLIEIED